MFIKLSVIYNVNWVTGVQNLKKNVLNIPIPSHLCLRPNNLNCTLCIMGVTDT